MQSRDFCYWLQGFLEVAKPETLDKEQLKVVQNHLNMVFKHEIDPSFGKNPVHQQALSNLHSGGNFGVLPNKSGMEIMKC